MDRVFGDTPSILKLHSSPRQEVVDMNHRSKISHGGQGDFGKNYFSIPTPSHPVKSSQNLTEDPSTESGSLGNSVSNSNGLDPGLEKLLNTDRWNIDRYIHQSLITEGVITKKRYTDCMCKTVGGKEVELHINPKSKRVSTQNLITCKSVWVCSVCRSRLLSQKSKQIEKVVEKSKTSNVMITFTVRHGKEDQLQELIEGIGQSFRDLRSDRVWLKMKKKFTHSWDVRNIETTWGSKNGFHSHIHQLIGFEKEMNSGDIDHLQFELFPVWRRLLRKYGMRDITMKYGLDVIKTDVGSYLTKWNISKELSSNLKSSKNGNWSIGDLEVENLKYSVDPNYKGSITHSQIKWVLSEYYKVMEGRKFLVVGGDFNKLVKDEEETSTEPDEDIFNLKKKDVVFVNGYFWNYLMKSGIGFGFIRQLETQTIPDSMDWLLKKIKNGEMILDNIRVVVGKEEED